MNIYIDIRGELHFCGTFFTHSQAVLCHHRMRIMISKCSNAQTEIASSSHYSANAIRNAVHLSADAWTCRSRRDAYY